ncbi:hypothetical protein OFB62_28755, partial [Escherichia coli]|nr:hypothetical protein [Escherichia coli]
RNRKAQALLAYLVLSAPPAEPRERLCGLLWSESGEDKARASLRQTLHGLRETFQDCGPEALRLGRDDVGLDRASFSVDALSVLDEARGGAV